MDGMTFAGETGVEFILEGVSCFTRYRKGKESRRDGTSWASRPKKMGKLVDQSWDWQVGQARVWVSGWLKQWKQTKLSVIISTILPTILLLWNKFGFIIFAWSLGSEFLVPSTAWLGESMEQCLWLQKGEQCFVPESEMLWGIQVVPHLGFFIHFPLDAVWIHGMEWCSRHWWFLWSVQLPCSTESGTELFRHLRWDSFSSAS